MAIEIMPFRSRFGLSRKRSERLAADAFRRLRSRDFWFEKLPFLRFASEYDAHCLTGDLVAGVTIALTVIPQGIGYAPLAGLPLQVHDLKVGDLNASLPCLVSVIEPAPCHDSHLARSAIAGLINLDPNQNGQRNRAIRGDEFEDANFQQFLNPFLIASFNDFGVATPALFTFL